MRPGYVWERHCRKDAHFLLLPPSAHSFHFLNRPHCSTEDSHCSTADSHCSTADSHCSTADSHCSTTDSHCSTADSHLLLRIPHTMEILTLASKPHVASWQNTQSIFHGAKNNLVCFLSPAVFLVKTFEPDLVDFLCGRSRGAGGGGRGHCTVTVH